MCYVFLHTRQYFPRFSPALTNLMTYPYPTSGVDKKWTTTRMCCQYIGCIDDHVTLSLDVRSWRHCNVTYDVNFQFGRGQRIRTWLVNGDSFVESNAGDQKVCKKKNLSWLFGVDRKTLASLGTASWYQTVTLGRIFLSAPHTILVHKAFLIYNRSKVSHNYVITWSSSSIVRGN